MRTDPTGGLGWGDVSPALPTRSGLPSFNIETDLGTQTYYQVGRTPGELWKLLRKWWRGEVYL